jgi:hypothetical protein
MLVPLLPIHDPPRGMTNPTALLVCCPVSFLKQVMLRKLEDHLSVLVFWAWVRCFLGAVVLVLTFGGAWYLREPLSGVITEGLFPAQPTVPDLLHPFKSEGWTRALLRAQHGHHIEGGWVQLFAVTGDGAGDGGDYARVERPASCEDEKVMSTFHHGLI